MVLSWGIFRCRHPQCGDSQSLHVKNFLCAVDIPSNPLLYGLYHFSYHSIVLRNIPKLCHEGHPQRGARQFLYVINVHCYMDYTIIHVNDSLSSSYHCIVLSFSCLIVVLCHASCGTCRPVMMLASRGKQSSKEAGANVSQCCSLMGYGLRPQTCFG